MNNQLQVSETVEKVTAFLSGHEKQFHSLNSASLNTLDFAQECEFARQLLMRNEYTLNAARLNPDSLHTAISNVAAIGITLNPAQKFAYLVPRKVNKEMQICLDISYRGLTKLATDTGIIKALKAELVYANDTFKYHGFHEKPVFKADAFGDRGGIIGVYAMALMVDGSVLVETMTIDEVNKIRDDSEAYKSAKSKGGWSLDNNVWVKFYGEMIKKTCIKRAHKTLPTSHGTEILGKAIDVINEHEGIDFEAPKELTKITYTDEEFNEYKRCIDENDYFNLVPLIRSLDVEAQAKLKPMCMPDPGKGNKGRQSDKFSADTKESSQQLDASIQTIQESLDSGDDGAVAEILEGCTQWTIEYITSKLSHEHQIAINQIEEVA